MRTMHIAPSLLGRLADANRLAPAPQGHVGSLTEGASVADLGRALEAIYQEKKRLLEARVKGRRVMFVDVRGKGKGAS